MGGSLFYRSHLSEGTGRCVERHLPCCTRGRDHRLVVYREKQTGLLVCGGRVQIFIEGIVAFPILPYRAWISVLLAREAHSIAQDGFAGTMLRMKWKAWVIRERRMAQKVIDGCRYSRKATSWRCQQVMGDPRGLSLHQSTFRDHMKDSIKKGVTQKVWGVIFCFMANWAIHTELTSTLSFKSFLMERFTAIRGHHRKVVRPRHQFYWSKTSSQKNFTVTWKAKIKQTWRELQQKKRYWLDLGNSSCQLTAQKWSCWSFCWSH